jgi:hypothetical protein
MKIKVVIVSLILLIVGVIVWAKTSSNENFAQAKDFPNGALIYVQVADLPQLNELWNESKLKDKYLESQNYADFSTSHLGIKLAERLEDLNNSVGFPIDLQTLGSLAEKQAAIAVYDIGKLDIVFVAPMNETLFSATMFAQNSNKFEENTLADGTVFYQLEIEVDRKRQKQKIIFGNIKNRFVLATTEQLFIRTVSAITGKHRLYDELLFTKLSENITPKLMTIWVNQEKLNADYYFKRYWLMSKVEDLQNIRAGIFDLELSENGLTEHREFLLKQPQTESKISSVEANELLAKVPENVPFYRLQKASEKNIGEAIYNTLFDRENTVEKPRNSRNYKRYNNYDDYTNNFAERRYSYLDSDFDENVNENVEDEAVKIEPLSTDNIQVSGNPTTILTAVSPQILENPLFAEFRKITVISLKSPTGFQANQFENSIVEALKNRVTVADTKFIWETEGGLRKLKIPMLGWEIGYLFKDGKLFVANSFEFLESFVSAKTKQSGKANFNDLTVIRLQNHEANFEQIIQKLAVKNDDFFVGNIESLLAVIGDVKQVEIRKKNEGLILREEISALFQQTVVP